MIAVLLVKDPDGNCLFLAETEGKIIIFVMVQHVCVVYTICVCVTLWFVNTTNQKHLWLVNCLFGMGIHLIE